MATKNSTNLAPNMASALCYVPVVGFVAAIVLLIVEKNTVVRWNAIQSLMLGLLPWVVNILLGLTVVLALVVPIIWFPEMLIVFVVQLFLAVRAYQGATVKLPMLGNWTDKIIKQV